MNSMKLSKAINEIKAMMGSSSSSKTVEVSRSITGDQNELMQSMNNRLKLSPKIEPKFQASSALKGKLNNSNRASLTHNEGSVDKTSPTKHFDISSAHH